MSDVTHVLWCPEVLQDVLNLLDIVGAGARTEGSLVTEAAVRAFDAHISDSAW